jgi:hypothetical protein
MLFYQTKLTIIIIILRLQMQSQKFVLLAALAVILVEKN